MSKMTKQANTAAIKAVIGRCNAENKSDLGGTLKGIIVDWSSAQIAGIKNAFGEEKSEELLRGCKVQYK